MSTFDLFFILEPAGCMNFKMNTASKTGIRSGSGSRNYSCKEVDKIEQLAKSSGAFSTLFDTDFHVCFLCDKKFTDRTDNLLHCGRCDGWACTGCLSMSPETYSVIARPDLRWFCEQCVQLALLSVKSDKAIEDKY